MRDIVQNLAVNYIGALMDGSSSYILDTSIHVVFMLWVVFNG